MASTAAGSVSIGAWPTPGTSTRSHAGRLALHPVGDVGGDHVGQFAAEQQGRPLARQPAEQQPGDPRSSAFDGGLLRTPQMAGS